MDFKIEDDETLDGPLGLKIIQKKNGYRYSQDSLHLADFARAKKNDHVIDLGTGCGIIALLVAQKNTGKKIVGLEIQKEFADLAKRNVSLNNFQGKVEIIEGDLQEVKSLFQPHSFDCVISNPPYGKVKESQIKSKSQRVLARHEILCDMSDILEAMRYLLKSLGRGVCIYPAQRFEEMIVKAKDKGFQLGRVQFIHANLGKNAELVMAELIKEGKSKLEVMPPIFSTTSV